MRKNSHILGMQLIFNDNHSEMSSGLEDENTHHDNLEGKLTGFIVLVTLLTHITAAATKLLSFCCLMEHDTLLSSLLCICLVRKSSLDPFQKIKIQWKSVLISMIKKINIHSQLILLFLSLLNHFYLQTFIIFMIDGEEQAHTSSSTLTYTESISEAKARTPTSATSTHTVSHVLHRNGGNFLFYLVFHEQRQRATNQQLGQTENPNFSREIHTRPEAKAYLKTCFGSNVSVFTWGGVTFYCVRGERYAERDMCMPNMMEQRINYFSSPANWQRRILLC